MSRIPLAECNELSPHISPVGTEYHCMFMNQLN